MNVGAVARARWRLAVRTFAPRPGSGRGGLVRAVVAGGAAALIPVMLWLGFAGLFDILQVEGAGPREAAAALALAFNAALIVLLVSDLHAAVAMLLTDPDLELLRRAPLSARQVLFLKLADALPQTAAGLALVAVPATLAYAGVYPIPAWGWALFVALLACLWAVPLALGSAGALWVLGRVPGRRAREALGALSAFMVFFVWLGSALMSFSKGDQFTTMVSLRETLQRLPAAILHGPAGWAATAIGGAAAGVVEEAVSNTIWLALAAIIAIALAAWTAQRRLEVVQARLHGGGAPRHAGVPRGWEGAVAAAGAAHAATTPAGAAHGAPAEGAALPGATRGPRRPAGAGGLVRALAARDARLFTRDWPVLSDVVISAILWSLLPVLWSSLFEDRATTMARAMFLALSVGLGNEIAGRAVPIERQALAWSRVAPLAPSTWIAGKLAISWLASLMVLAIAGAFTIPALGLSWVEGAGVFATTLPALALATSLGLWSGAHFGKSDWNNPRGMLNHSGRLVSVVLMMTQVGAWWSWAALLGRPGVDPAIAWGLPAVAVLLAVLVLAGLARKVRAGLAV